MLRFAALSDSFFFPSHHLFPFLLISSDPTTVVYVLLSFFRFRFDSLSCLYFTFTHLFARVVFCRPSRAPLSRVYHALVLHLVQSFASNQHCITRHIGPTNTFTATQRFVLNLEL